MEATGKDNKNINFEGPTIFENGKNYYLIAGISNSIGNSVRSIYIDSEGGNDFAVIDDHF